MTVGRSIGHSESFTAGKSFSQTRGISQTLHKRALITPDEVGRLFGNPEDMRAIALVSGYQPMAVTRTPYFRDIALETCYDRHRDHASPPSKLVMRTIQKDRKEKHEMAVFVAKRAAEKEAERQADYNRRYWHQRRREEWIAGWVYNVKLAACWIMLAGIVYMLSPLILAIWSGVSRLMR